MTFEELLLFRGNASDLEEYKRLLKKRDSIKKQIRTLSNKIYDEDDSIFVFAGELSERDEQLLKSHVAKRKKLYTKREKKKSELMMIEKKINEFR